MSIGTTTGSGRSAGTELRCGAVALGLVLFAASETASAAATVTTFDVNGASRTEAVAINAGGAVTGYWLDSSSIDEGFVRASDGTITTFAPAGSIDTLPSCINRRGTIAGYYVSNSHPPTLGFVRRPGGGIKSFR